MGYLKQSLSYSQREIRYGARGYSRLSLKQSLQQLHPSSRNHQVILGIHFAPTTHYYLVHPSNLTTATKPEACRCRVTIYNMIRNWLLCPV
eukprot:scaffold13297_cov101-Skeletonema_dohrnii-CCMP3373.AAC.1